MRSPRPILRNHSSRSPGVRRSAGWAVVATVGVVSVGGGLVAMDRSRDDHGATFACPDRHNQLRVVTAPEIAPTVTAAAEKANFDRRQCAVITVVAAEPQHTVTTLRHAESRPDVWVPDSSIWLSRESARMNPGMPAAGPSLAQTPYVLAVPAPIAASIKPGAVRLGLADLIPPSGRATPIQWALPSADSSAASVAAVVALQMAVAHRPDSATVLNTVVGTSDRGPVDESRTNVLAAAARMRTAIPTTTQQLSAHNRVFPNSQLVPAYPTPEVTADYPFVSLATGSAQRDLAAGLLARLRRPDSVTLLRDAGFQVRHGEDDRAAVGAPTNRQIEAAGRALTAIARPSRVLAVLDVSGSMAETVPGAAGVTRLELAVQAAANGLALYTDDTVAGLWVFSTKLTPTTDYRAVVSPIPLGRGSDGITGRQRLARALATIRVTKGWTGLYDTTLAATREMRRSWDPHRANSVVIITDGGNQDPNGGVDLTNLLRTLRRENDPARPVPVFAISYGPSGDLRVLRDIALATAGKAYPARDPRRIDAVLSDAIGRRACAPGC